MTQEVLATKAEHRADEARQLSEFNNFSLPGVRDKVAEMLRLIGHKEIFATYTKHDISHIDKMLNMLEWLVPETTMEKMTPADWLLVVLGIYLHDLGMLVTTEEYEKRYEDEVFCSWIESLNRTNEGREYVARIYRMSSDEKEHFFFQEWVRKGHAMRIREWVTGQHTRQWGPQVSVIAKEVEKLLDPLPIRFREYLGEVCESHHADNLDRQDRFPLYAHCGVTPQASVNVQYSAILLRTVDLLHVTQDRTPSVMFQIIRLSDPKGVMEWDKQLGTFAALPKKRKFNPADPESGIIQISANFQEESPLFALQEYIIYANNQIGQSRRWVDKSQEDPDGEDYSFPWHTVKGDVRLEGVPPSPLKFELDRGRLLNLLIGHTIYNDATVAIRELLQNAIDAVRFQHHLDVREVVMGQKSPDMGIVRVHWKPNDRKLIIEDNGTGMDRDIIEHHLMMVGSSYYDTPQFESDYGNFSPISRFGIGVLTCFMVSDDIEILTCRKGKGYRIRMTSVDIDYLLRELSPHDQLLVGIEPHGTRVTLRLRETVDVAERTVRDIVQHWIILPSCRVEYVEDDNQPEPIGFNSPEAALKHFHTAELRSRSHEEENWEPKLEFIVKEYTREGKSKFETAAGQYELAFAVNYDWLLERSFASVPERNLPAVCIEGIRVSDSLPWFKGGTGRISALLSVKNDRRFRTTVSRSGLEEDEEFHHVGRLCAKMLFNHIEDEVIRISHKSGFPLSQASSASIWLYTQITGFASDNDTTHEYLSFLYNGLPSMVIEKQEHHNLSNPKTSRILISSNQLAEEPAFWTIESRLLDSLGVISRDLGRELSLNEFLDALAPDYGELQFTPLLPDAHLSYFQQRIIEVYRPKQIEFSRRNQQAATKWIQRGKNYHSISIDIKDIFTKEVFNDRKFIERFQEGNDEFFGRIHDSIYGISHINVKVDFAGISGDDSQVHVVISRMGVTIKEKSVVSDLLDALVKSLYYLKEKHPDSDRLMSAFLAFYSFGYSISEGAIDTMYRHYGRSELDLSYWREGVDIIRDALEDLQIDIDLPDNLRKFTRESGVFRASRYWRDWSKSSA